MKFVVTSALALAVSSTASHAQSPLYAQPKVLSAGRLLGDATQPAGLFGASFAPDGRLALMSKPNGTLQYSRDGFYVAVFRPEVVTTNSLGIPTFPAPTGSGASAWSQGFMATDAVRSMENMKCPPLQTPPATQHSSGRYQFFKGWVSMAPDPAFRLLPCPYPSNDLGTPANPGTASATHETYSMLVVGADSWKDIDPSAVNDVTWPKFLAGSNVEVMPIGMRKLQVVVSSPKTATASIHSATMDAKYDVLRWQDGADSGVVLGLEPALSLDGRLLIFQGNPVNNTRAWNAARTTIDRLMYTFNPVPGVPTGWSKPMPLESMHANEVGRLVNGVPFSELYPIAAAPLANADGTPITGEFRGAYPWLTIDGTDVVFSARLTNDQSGARDHGFCIIGRSTGYKLRLVDGPMNPDRNVTRRVITTGTGRAPGIWQWGGDTPNLNLPYTRHSPVLPIFDAEWHRYGEISLHEYQDRSYLLALDMNELIQNDPINTSVSWRIDTTRTPDTSGNAHTGVLQNGAEFPQEAGLGDANAGIVGQCVICKGTGSVRVANTPLLGQSLSAITVGCWFSQQANGKPAVLIDKAGAYRIAANAQGQVQVTLKTTAGTRTTAFLGSVQTSTWRHVAFTYDATGNLIVYVDGNPVLTQTGAPNTPTAASTSTLLIGPAGITVQVGPPTGKTLIDQVRISSVARTKEELGRDALLAPLATGLQTLPTTFALPLGLDRAETKVPAGNVPTPASIFLGETLFHDTRLSTNGRSCATCHVDGLSFTDTIPQRPPLTVGGKLLLNSPATLNRAFSTRQFFDGRAASLEDQVLHPLFHPDEMASSTTQVLALVQSSTSGYPPLFQAAYGNVPIKIGMVQAALASYQRALVAGDSPADKFEAGVGSLTANEISGRNLFFGKARCFGCHSGSNYTDERFHVSLFKPLDGAGVLRKGRGEVTGIAGDMFRFKTPTLRNLVDTAPYFHDGRAATLTDVIEMYDRGGDWKDPVDEEIFPLGLTSQEKADLEAFLKTLSGAWRKL